ncbi:hypothetical protein [Bartonella schoenbuchensis]|uniref:Uncharacterized protein n=1 Tax=Bartonella schoenbuchensis m07a TaxID=1094496 RepID=N6VJ38_9HYPH|nr:hypothetical protein [Bartonella schoenbuchensis]ENN91042.1 hypothetical protein m07a_10480 [Bartonella schoenbuchensis m07a]
MSKQISIDNYEILLVVCDDDYPYAQFGPLEETEIMNIINGVGDVVSILRIDLQSNRYDDISEDIAELYVKDSDSSLLERNTHPFIVDSNAYHILKEDVEKQKYADEVYGTYEEQHRLRLCDVLNMNYRRMQ